MWENRIWILASLMSYAGATSFCSRLDKIVVDLEMPATSNEDTMRTLHTLTRITSPSVATVEVTKVEWKSVYCPAVEFGPFQDCQQAEGSVYMDERDLSEMRQGRRVSRPGTCDNQVCDGSSKEACLTPSVFYLDKPPFEYNAPLSSSWLHHRCAREVSSVTLKVDSIMSNIDANFTQMEIPGIGQCLFKSEAGGCVIDHKWVALVDASWERKVSVSSFPCIEKGLEKVCYDKVTKLQFFLGPENCNVLNGATYCRVGEAIGSRGGSEKVKVVTPEVVYELSLQLEYENLETAFDHQVILNRFHRVNRLLSSLLLHALDVTPDPLQQYLGFGITNVTRQGNLISGNVCQRSYSNDPHFPANRSGMVNISLFNNVEKFGPHEVMASRIPFISRPDLTGHTHFNATRVRHGDADIINTVSLGDFLMPKWFGSLPWFITHILPVLNSIFLFMALWRRI